MYEYTTCAVCGEEIRYGDEIFVVEDSNDIICNKDKCYIEYMLDNISLFFLLETCKIYKINFKSIENICKLNKLDIREAILNQVIKKIGIEQLAEDYGQICWSSESESMDERTYYEMERDSKSDYSVYMEMVRI